MGKYYVSTPIYYVNDVPHIGTAYPTVAADVIARFHRMIGDDVLFSTGTDENATKVARVAAEKGINTLQFVEQMAASFKDTWQKMNISYDDFLQTVEPRHFKAVQNLIEILYNNGDVYYSEYEGWYCIPCETHFMEAQLNECKCPDCNRSVEWMKEPGYFFKLSKYQQPLLDYIESNPNWLQPDFRKNEVVSFIKSGLRDVNITRKAEWGIPVPENMPGAEGLVIYVWYDALINYITVAGYGQDEEKFKKWWPAQAHIVGKDIFTRFHATLWPAMLMGAGIELPKTVVAHGFWTISGEKISKSKHGGKGFRINPLDLSHEIVDASGADLDIAVDALRYFLLREMSFGADGDFSLEALFRRYNSDLANDLGNLLNRVITMIGKYCDGIIPTPAPPLSIAIATAESANFYLNGDVVNYNETLKSVWELVSYLNRYIEEMAPWKLFKEGKKAEVNDIMYTLAEGLRFTAIILSPFMPTTAKQIASQIGWECDDWKWDDLKWGILNRTNNVCPTKPIFPRILEKKEIVMTEEIVKVTEPVKEPEPVIPVIAEEVAIVEELITIDDFAKVKLKTGTIIAAEKHPKADKLLKLQVELGEEKPRQIIAGIAMAYSPDDLIGRQVIVVANLQPAKLRGEISEGMLLAADMGENGMSLLKPDKDVANGNKVR